jgi:hypothetical protein
LAKFQARRQPENLVPCSQKLLGKYPLRRELLTKTVDGVEYMCQNNYNEFVRTGLHLIYKTQ